MTDDAHRAQMERFRRRAEQLGAFNGHAVDLQQNENDDEDDEAGWDPITAGAHYARHALHVISLLRKAAWRVGWPELGSTDVSDVVQDVEQAIARAGSPDGVRVGWTLGADGYMALDVDDPTKLGDELRAVLDAGGYATNPTSKPGRFHAIFRMPAGLVVGNSTSKFPERGWGEVRGHHGQICIAGPDRPGFDVAELGNVIEFPRPEWLTPFVDAGTPASDGDVARFLVEHGAAEGYPRALDVIVEHAEDEAWAASRHDRARDALAWALRDARIGLFPAATAVSRLRVIFLDAVAGDAERALVYPHPEREIDDLIARAVSLANAMTDDEMRERRWDAVIASVAPPPIATSTSVIAIVERAASSSFDPVDLGPYLAGVAMAVVPDCLVMSDGRGLLHKARLNGVHGDSGTGKSWLMAFVIRELISKREAVMLVDLEDSPEPLIERLRQIGVTDEQIGRLVVFVRPDEHFADENVERLMAHIAERDVVHVVIDSLGEAFSLEGLNEDRDVEVAPWLRRVCRRIIDHTRAGVTLIDHGTKSTDKPLDPSGSKRKKAAITGCAWLMTSSEVFTKETGGSALLRCAKDRHGTYRRGDTVARLVMGPLGAHVSGQTSLALDAALGLDDVIAIRVESDLDVVVGVLGATPMSLDATFAAVRDTGHKMRDATIKGVLELAVVRGRAVESKGAKNARLFVLACSAQGSSPAEHGPSSGPSRIASARPDDGPTRI